MFPSAGCRSTMVKRWGAGVFPRSISAFICAMLRSREEPLEVAFTIGNDPYVTLCSQISGSIYLDELNVAGGWMGQPVEVVKCETIDVQVPATSEIVIEGELLPGERRTEGPFGEFPDIIKRLPNNPFSN